MEITAKPYFPPPSGQPRKPAVSRTEPVREEPAHGYPRPGHQPKHRLPLSAEFYESFDRQRASPVTREFVSDNARRAIDTYQETMDAERRDEIKQILGFDAYA